MKRLKKVVVAALMSLLLIFSLSKSFNVGHIAAAEYVSNFVDFTAAVKKAGVTEIVIEKSFDMPEIITIPNGKTITIMSADSNNPVTLKRSAEANGGYGYIHYLFEIEKGGSLTLSNIIIDGNKEKAKSYIVMVMVFGTFIMENSVLKNNDATTAGLTSFTYGGAIYIQQSGKAIIRNSTINGNVSQGTGGAIQCFGELMVENSEFYDNLAKSEGGAIYLAANSRATISDSVFKNNKATAKGGAIHIEGGKLDINDTELSNNVAATDGGGISNNGTLTMKGCLLTGNIAARGGGLCVRTTIAEVSAILEDNRFLNNQATEEGGAIYDHLGIYGNNTLILKNHEIQGNTAKLGGGVFVSAGTIIIDESTIIDNKADQGGGICIKDRGSLVLKSGVIADNTAVYDGGGIFIQNYNNAILPEDSTITFRGNKANNLWQPPTMPVIPANQWQGSINSVSVDFVGDARLTVLNNYDINYNLTEVLKQYSLSYLANGGSGSTVNYSGLIPGVGYSMTANTFSAPEGKIFIAWNTQSDGNGITYTEGQTIVMPAGDLSLYAIWGDVTPPEEEIPDNEIIDNDEDNEIDNNKETIDIRYLPNGGSGDEVKIGELTVGQQLVIAANVFVAPTNKQFIAWNTREDGKGDSYHEGQEIIVPETDLQLYAVWANNSRFPNTGDNIFYIFAFLFMLITGGIIICLVYKKRLNKTL